MAGPLRRVSGQRFRPTMEAFRAAFAGRACLAALAWNGRTIGAANVNVNKSTTPTHQANYI